MFQNHIFCGLIELNFKFLVFVSVMLEVTIVVSCFASFKALFIFRNVQDISWDHGDKAV